jgi:hypothetical protein
MYRSQRVSKANDATIKVYVRLAARLGHEDADSKYEWKDGGLVASFFRTVDLRDDFDDLLPLWM